MKETSIEELRSNLLSEDLQKQILALDDASRLVQEIVMIAVQMLETGPERFLVAERLHKLGPNVVQPLESLLLRSENSEVKVLASLVLLQLGSKTGVDILLQALQSDRNYVVLIAQHLSVRKVYESVDGMIFRLRQADNSETDLIVGLLGALDELRASIPDDLVIRFQQPSMPYQVRTVIEQILKRNSEIQ